MIRVLLPCIHRQESFASVCLHSDNSGKTITIDDCHGCQIADPGFVSSSGYHGSIQDELPENERPEMSLWDKAKRLAEGAVGVTQAVLGIDPAPKEMQAARWATCQACDQYDLGECKACGCYVSLKLRILHQNCPLGFWMD